MHGQPRTHAQLRAAQIRSTALAHKIVPIRMSSGTEVVGYMEYHRVHPAIPNLNEGETLRS